MGMEITEKFKEAFQKINKAKNILLVAHERPDGDAIASLCAMIDLLENFGKKYKAFCQGQPINHFSFLPRVEKIIFENIFKISNENRKLNFYDFDLIITLDCGSLERTGLAEEIGKKEPGQFVIEFDHHPRIKGYSDLEIRKPEAAATAEILYYFFKANKIKITKNIANCLLTGILTDSGNFLYPMTSGETMSIASEMLLYGAKFPQIVRNTVHNKSLAAMKLWGMALSGLKINKKYNFAFSVLTLDEVEKKGGNDDIFDSISGFLSNLYGVNGVLFLREIEGGYLKGSLRSAHPDADVSALAVALGGGGHKKASGFVLEGKLKKVGESWKII
jgi:phosphoesterase RecJ-like protein